MSSFPSFNNTCSIFFPRSSVILRASKTSSSVWDETLLASVLIFLSSGEGVESFEDLLLAFRLTGIEKNKDCFTEVDGARLYTSTPP